MSTNTISRENYQEVLDSALDILFYYEEDEYDFLADESVICDLMENYGFNIVDAHALLGVAQVKHQERIESGFYS
jgi:hypothetical protein